MPEPDRSFMRDLKNLDKRLDVKWNGANFIVTYARGYGEPVNIIKISDDYGGFRQPNRLDLEAIKGGDLAQGDSMDARLRKLSYASEQIRERLKQKARDDIRHMTRDNRRQLEKAFRQRTNQGKANATFRRIEPKVKGVTAGEILERQKSNPDNSSRAEV